MARNFGGGRKKFSGRETKTEMEIGIKIKRRGEEFGRNKMISSTLRIGYERESMLPKT